jgi:hypothetical protein
MTAAVEPMGAHAVPRGWIQAESRIQAEGAVAHWIAFKRVGGVGTNPTPRSDPSKPESAER